MSRPLYSLVLDDGNRNLSKRPGQTSDCTVRAFAIITGKSYDEVYETLAKAGRRPCDGFDSSGWLKQKRGRVFGGCFKKIDLKEWREHITLKKTIPYVITPSNFADAYPVGSYLLETPSHTWAVIDGIHHDLWRIKEQPLTGAWQWHPNS